MKKGKTTGRLTQIGLWILALVHIYPILFIVSSALKSKTELYSNSFGPPKKILLTNFIDAFQDIHYFRSFFNTAFLTIMTVLLLILVSSAAAYAIVRRGGKFYNGLYLFFMAGMIVPFQMLMLPLYKVMVKLELVNNHWGLIMVYIAQLAPFSILLFSGFIRTVPKELEEAATIDGSGFLHTFFRIVLPLLSPAIATIAVLDSFAVWNDFLMPLLFLTDPEKMTLVVQLNAFIGQYLNDWSLIFASILMIMLPVMILYLFAQRFIINGITAGAIKG